jgi:hypothetical protein
MSQSQGRQHKATNAQAGGAHYRLSRSRKPEIQGAANIGDEKRQKAIACVRFLP